VKRILSRNHPEIDEGWLCDKGRFAYPALRADDRVVEPLSRSGRRRFEPLAWDEALDEAERLLREADGRVVLALSGTETVEQAYALARLLRDGLHSDAVVLPEASSAALAAFRLPLSAIRDAELVVVLGDDPVADRAPVVDLWLRAAQRKGAEVVFAGQAPRNFASASSELRKRLRASNRAVLVWSGPDAEGGAAVARLARTLGFGDKPGCGAFYLPATPNGRGVAQAWAEAGGREPRMPSQVGLVILSGDDAASDPQVRALAEGAGAVIAIAMFAEGVRGLADLVLPGTSYLERDGTMVNLEGRSQRLRRAVIPPAPDELAWIAKLAGRFGVELSPYVTPSAAERAPLPPRGTLRRLPAAAAEHAAQAGPLRLARYRPLFAGPEVERVPELQFQRPQPEVELAADDAAARGIQTGDLVRIRSNGTTVSLRARVTQQLAAGAIRIADEHAGELEGGVEVSR
jgi:NADH-quinone oxidoreductase subunit G